MKKYRIKSQYNYDYKKDTSFEKTSKDTLVIQNEATSIKDLIKQHAAGIMSNDIYRNALYDDDPTHEDFDKREVMNMDLADKQELGERAKEAQKILKDLEKKPEKEEATKPKTATDEKQEKTPESEPPKEEKTKSKD